MSARPFVSATVLLGVVVLLSMTNSFAAGLSLTSQPLAVKRTCTLTGTTGASTAMTDASVRQANATTNFGTSTTNNVASAASANRRLYLSFNFARCSPVIPSTATVQLATARLYFSGLAAACRTLDIFRVTSTWTETGITWNNQPFGTTINNPPTSSRTDSFDVGTPVGCQNQAAGYAVGADVTADVAAFIAGTSTNFGWMIRDDVEGSATARTETISAKELATLTQAPQLIVTYVTVP